MKCKFCGGEVFVGHQHVYMDVLTDGEGNFVDNLPGGGANIYGSGDPYGPFTCGSCGAIYDELDGSAPMEDPFENCTGPDKTRLAYDGSILFTKVKDELSDRRNRRFQRWDSLSYQVNIAIWEMGHVAIAVSKKSDASCYLPDLDVVVNDADALPQRINVKIPAYDALTQEAGERLLNGIEDGLYIAKAIEDLFIRPIREGNFIERKDDKSGE